jgi:hypothetical protein
MMRTRIVSVCLFVCSLAACGGAPPPPAKTPPAGPPPSAAQAELNGAPKWVLMGCGAFFGEKKNVVCGVGVAAGMGDNVALARTAAQGRGRTEIARSLRVRVKSMLKDYQQVAAAQGKAASEQLVEDTAKQVTDVTLSGTRLQDMWVSASGTYYVLMVLDVDAFRSSIKDMKQLDEAVRAAIVQRAERSFAELDAEVEGKKAE